MATFVSSVQLNSPTTLHERSRLSLRMLIAPCAALALLTMLAYFRFATPVATVTQINDNQILSVNVTLALRAALVATLQIVSAFQLGRYILSKDETPKYSCSLVLLTTVGAAALSLPLTLLSICHLAYPSIVLAVGFLPLALSASIASFAGSFDRFIPNISCRRLMTLAGGTFIAAMTEANYLSWSASIANTAVIANLLIAGTILITLRGAGNRVASYLIRERLWPIGARISPLSAITGLADVAVGYILAQPILYASLLCLTQPVGPDMPIYHLAIPRDTLLNHGLDHNHFCYASGLQYAWHMFGMPTFAIGGDRGYQCLSFAAFLGVVALAYSIARVECHADFQTKSAGDLAGISAAVILIGISRACISNNDIGCVLTELILVLLAIRWWKLNELKLAFIIALVGGWALAIKLTTLPGVAAAYLLYVLTMPQHSLRHAAIAATGIVLIGAIWPVFAFINTGSPLPQHLLGMRSQSAPYPHLQETLSILNVHYVTWLKANVHRLFTGGNAIFSVVALGVPIGICTSTAFRANRTIKLLLAFALGRFALLCTLQHQAVYHDRYHLVSLVSIGIAGAIGWNAFLTQQLQRLSLSTDNRLLAHCSIIFLPTVFLLWINLSSGWVMTLPYRFDTEQTDGCVWKSAPQPSLLDERRSFWLEFWTKPGSRGPHVKAFDWIRDHLPEDALIAGTSIVPYWSDRRYMQISPVAQDRIDLRKTPEELRELLIAAGVSYIHIHSPGTSDGVMPWATPEINKWLKSIRAIALLKDVKQVAAFRGEGKIEDAIYDLGTLQSNVTKREASVKRAIP